MHRLIVAFGHLPAVVEDTPGVVAREPYNRLLAAARGSASKARSSATLPCRQWPVESRRSAARASIRRFPKACSASATLPDLERRNRPRSLPPGRVHFRRRSLPYPALQNFDTPNGDFSCVRRRSNTPLQALTTLNEVIFVECAGAGPADSARRPDRRCRARLTFAFRSCVSRPRPRPSAQS